MEEYHCEVCKKYPMKFFYNRKLLCPGCYVKEKELEEGKIVDLEGNDFNMDDYDI